VGIFAVVRIPKDARVQLWSDQELRFIRKPVRGTLRLMAERYGIELPEGYWCPLDFNSAEIGWYINHSDEPNMVHADFITLKALRTIKAGEELTIDYDRLPTYHTAP
jgi:hypothetical protein